MLVLQRLVFKPLITVRLFLIKIGWGVVGLLLVCVSFFLFLRLLLFCSMGGVFVVAFVFCLLVVVVFWFFIYISS